MEMRFRRFGFAAGFPFRREKYRSFPQDVGWQNAGFLKSEGMLSVQGDLIPAREE